MFQIVDQLIKVNHSKGRLQKVSMVVIHVMEGDLPASIKNPYTWFNNPAAKVSAHYGVPRLPGPIRRWVKEEDTAWANGRVDRPTAQQVFQRRDMNPNAYSVSIENEGRCNDVPTDFQMKANVWLTAQIAKRHGFVPTRHNVVGHNEIYKTKPCPCKFDVNAISRGAMAVQTGADLNVLFSTPDVSATVPIGTRRWSDYFQEHVIVTHYESDNNWTFVTESGLRQLGQRAQTPFSQMPKDRF